VRLDSEQVRLKSEQEGLDSEQVRPDSEQRGWIVSRWGCTYSEQRRLHGEEKVGK
jgi:hypothetical protein